MRLITLIFGLLACFILAAPVFADNLAMTTTAFLDQGVLPVLYTCDGKNISPEFAWTNPPANTQSFALVLSDPDAPSGIFYHWVIYNIPSSTNELTEGMEKLPAGTLTGKNSWDKTAYNGPCPPKGSVHNYIFTLYALGTKLALPAGADGKTVLAAIKGHVLKEVALTASYSRWAK